MPISPPIMLCSSAPSLSYYSFPVATYYANNYAYLSGYCQQLHTFIASWSDPWQKLFEPLLFHHYNQKKCVWQPIMTVLCSVLWSPHYSQSNAGILSVSPADTEATNKLCGTSKKWGKVGPNHCSQLQWSDIVISIGLSKSKFFIALIGHPSILQVA